MARRWYLENFLTGEIAAGPFDTQAEAAEFDPYDDRLEIRAADPQLPNREEDSVMNYIQQASARLYAEDPDLDQNLAQLYLLLALTKGTNTTLKDVHDAWAIWRNTTNPQHRSLIPFEQLTVEVQELDRPYMDAIHSAAAPLNGFTSEGSARSHGQQ